MTGRERAALQAFCSTWKKEIARLAAVLARVHGGNGGPIDAVGLAVAITIREDAVASIEAILGKKGAK
jgi:hypothetical protein